MRIILEENGEEKELTSFEAACYVMAVADAVVSGDSIIDRVNHYKNCWFNMYQPEHDDVCRAKDVIEDL